ncbi:putative short-chain oxidoreductase [Daldinia bambusicola]|nr:putative short-chain oxidoreductase [Daldinia bambusicola]
MTTFTKPNRPLTWLVTGATSGFGESLCRLILAGGHKLIATSRNPSRNPGLAAEINAHGNGCQFIQLDVDDRNSGQIIESLEASGAEIDVLVNNAGYCIYAPVETTAEEEVRALMETLYFGPVRLIRAAVPHMRKRRYGVIVNISSGAALDGRDSMGPYAGAKAALDGISKVLAKEVAPFGIRTLTVTLGTFNTNFANATIVGKIPLPDDYKGSVAEQMIQIMSSGKLQPNGDKDKAMKALYEVVIGEGAGKDREAERLLPLGQDMTLRVKGQLEYLSHALEAFKDVTDYVAVDKK